MLCPHFVDFVNLKKKIFQWTLYLCNLFRYNKKLEPYLQNIVIVNLLLKMLPSARSSNSKGMGNASSFLLWNICLFSTREVKKDHLQYMASAEISIPGWISPNFNPWSPHHWMPTKRKKHPRWASGKINGSTEQEANIDLIEEEMAEVFQQQAQVEDLRFLI